MSSDNGHVLVIGAAGIDIKARPRQDIMPETSNLGEIRNSVGGVARNVAENLARLEIPTVLLSAIGRDGSGKRVVQQARDRGIDITHVRRVPGARTGAYIAMLKPDGELFVAMGDFDVVRAIDRDYLLGHESLFAAARMLVLDLNLSEEALATAFELSARHNLHVCADPTSPELAHKLRPYLGQLYLVTPNAAELDELLGGAPQSYDRDGAIEAARRLVALGVDLAVVTLGEQGLAYADASGGGYIGALRTQIVDTTGAGDALTGAVIFGLLNGVPVDEAMRLGVTAAALTLQSRETVVPELSQELLYDRLVI